MDDYEIDDRGCPRCGHGHTHSRKCTVGCDGGEIVEDDGLNQWPADHCDVCHGTGIEWWCPSCGADLSATPFVDPRIC